MNPLLVLLEFGLEFLDVLLISFFRFGCTVKICALISFIPGLAPVTDCKSRLEKSQRVRSKSLLTWLRAIATYFACPTDIASNSRLPSFGSTCIRRGHRVRDRALLMWRLHGVIRVRTPIVVHHRVRAIVSGMLGGPSE